LECSDNLQHDFKLENEDNDSLNSDDDQLDEEDEEEFEELDKRNKIGGLLSDLRRLDSIEVGAKICIINIPLAGVSGFAVAI
jgi:hypothetical protein